MRAFDSVYRPSMWKKLEKVGIPNKIIWILSLLYEDSESCVRVGLEHTAWFGVGSGVIQGDTLSPILINKLLDYVTTELGTVNGGIDWIGGKLLKDLDCVDYLCLFA